MNSLSRSSLLWEEELLGLSKASAVWEEASIAMGLLYLPCLLPSQQEAAFLLRQEWCFRSHLLSRLQRDDNEDGSPVHSSHTATVAHEVVQDSGELGPHLPRRGEQTVSKERGHPFGQSCALSAFAGQAEGALGRGRHVTCGPAVMGTVLGGEMERCKGCGISEGEAQAFCSPPPRNGMLRASTQWLGCASATRLQPRTQIFLQQSRCHQRVHPSRLGQELVLLPTTPNAAGYLWGLVGHHHTLPSCHRVVHVLGEVVAFHPDEVAGWG